MHVSHVQPFVHHLRPFVPLVVDRHVRFESSTSAAEKPTNCQQCHQGSYALLWELILQLLGLAESTRPTEKYESRSGSEDHQQISLSYVSSCGSTVEAAPDPLLARRSIATQDVTSLITKHFLKAKPEIDQCSPFDASVSGQI